MQRIFVKLSPECAVEEIQQLEEFDRDGRAVTRTPQPPAGLIELRGLAERLLAIGWKAPAGPNR